MDDEQDADDATLDPQPGDPPTIGPVPQDYLTHTFYPTQSLPPYSPGDPSLDTRTVQPEEEIPFPLGRLNLPGYQTLAFIGRGGLGSVFLARHRELGLDVAIKVLHYPYSRYATDPRMLDVIQRLGRLRHDHLVATYGIGVQNHTTYLVMQYIEGQPLDGHVRMGLAEDLRERMRLLAQVARGTHFLHERGLIHRDIKPSNILIGLDGQARLADYGLAMLWPLTEVDPEQPLPLVGTPAFMAPEQARGLSQMFGPSLDIWALGATMFWLLTGQVPFRRNTLMETLRALLDEAVPSPRTLRADLPRELELICLRCLSHDLSKRYARAADLADDLDRYQAGEAIAWIEPLRRHRPWWAFWRRD